MLAELHAAILEDLDADGPRLVLADALQRHGDPRGELIAIQCELARLGCDRTRVALWKSPDVSRNALESTRRADWIGDALTTGDRETIAKLRQREHQLMSRHEQAWAGAVQSYRFGRGFIDHAFVPRKTGLDLVYRTHVRSLELAEATAGTLESPLLAQCRQLRVALMHATATAALIDRLGGVANPSTTNGGIHGQLPHLRELAVSGLADTSGGDSGRSEIGALSSALDRLIASPGFAKLEALDLYAQALDTPERIEQIVGRARLRDLRLGLNYLGGPLGNSSQPPIYDVLARTPAVGALETLDLFYPDIGNALASLVASPHLQPLRALRIVTGSAQVRCFEDGARAIGDALPELRVLDLRYSPFNRFLQDLVGGRGLRRLTHLGLRGCSLDDTSMRQLADSPLFQRLRVLDLRDNAITDKGAKALAASAPGQLEQLELGRNMLSVKGRDLLNAKFPDAKIEIGRPRK